MMGQAIAAVLLRPFMQTVTCYASIGFRPLCFIHQSFQLADLASDFHVDV